MEGFAVLELCMESGRSSKLWSTDRTTALCSLELLKCPEAIGLHGGAVLTDTSFNISF